MVRKVCCNFLQLLRHHCASSRQLLCVLSDGRFQQRTLKTRFSEFATFATFCVIIVHHFIFVQNVQKMRFCAFLKKVMLTKKTDLILFLEHLRMNHTFCLYIRLGKSKMDIFKNVQKWILFHQFYAQKREMM